MTGQVVLLQVHTGHNGNTLENTLAPGYQRWYPGALFFVTVANKTINP